MGYKTSICKQIQRYTNKYKGKQTNTKKNKQKQNNNGPSFVNKNKGTQTIKYKGKQMNGKVHNQIQRYTNIL